MAPRRSQRGDVAISVAMTRVRMRRLMPGLTLRPAAFGGLSYWGR